MKQERIILPRLLSREGQVTRLLNLVMGLPIDKAWRVTIEEAKSERSTAQNAYLFGVAYKLIAESTGYEADDLHTSLLGKHFGVKLKKVPKSKHNRDGLIEVPVRTTTTDERGNRSVLGKMQFAEYVDFVIRFAAEKCDVIVPPPDPDFAEHREEKAA